MVRTRAQNASPARVIALTLAFMALALRVLVPSGMMVAPTNDLPFAIVLCTGDGSVTVAPGQEIPGHDKAPAQEGKHAPCAFAGLTAGAVAPDVETSTPVIFAAYAAALPAVTRDLAPGRGLTAPPPPARGPPSLLI
jgi:hypothetical protein